MKPAETKVNGTAFERHAQTVLVMLLVALLLWVGSTTQKTSLAIAEMRIEMGHMKQELARPATEFDELSKRVDLLSETLAIVEAHHAAEGKQ